MNNIKVVHACLSVRSTKVHSDIFLKKNNSKQTLDFSFVHQNSLKTFLFPHDKTLTEKVKF